MCGTEFMRTNTRCSYRLGHAFEVLLLRDGNGTVVMPLARPLKSFLQLSGGYPDAKCSLRALVTLAEESEVQAALAPSEARAWWAYVIRDSAISRLPSPADELMGSL